MLIISTAIRKLGGPSNTPETKISFQKISAALELSWN